jgi:hypothetical protein
VQAICAHVESEGDSEFPDLFEVGSSREWTGTLERVLRQRDGAAWVRDDIAAELGKRIVRGSVPGLLRQRDDRVAVVSAWQGRSWSS